LFAITLFRHLFTRLRQHKPQFRYKEIAVFAFLVIDIVSLVVNIVCWVIDSKKTNTKNELQLLAKEAET